MRKTNVAKKLCLIALLTLILGTLLCVAINAETYSGECGAEGNNLTWTLDTAKSELVISGTGEMKDYTSSSNAPWYSYYRSIETVTIGDSVTSIGNYALNMCLWLTRVSIPDSVTSIGNYAFLDCDALTSVTIPDSVTSIEDSAFYSCSSLTSVTIPDSVTSIGNHAFYACERLASVTIPDSVTSIGKSAFYYCNRLTSVTVLSKTVSIHISSDTFPSRATIYGYADSTAEAYAKKYSRTFRCVEAHTYATELAHSNTQHWHACSVCGYKKDVAAHKYDNACDTTCACGYVRVAPHSFDNACDTTCNDCSYTRTITHSYNTTWSTDSQSHWYTCSVCGVKRDTATHTYKTTWSTNSTYHWSACSVCGYKKDMAAHKFDNACDTTCNVCGYTRTTTHSYNTTWSTDSQSHWYTCSDCGAKKDETAHSYDNACDTNCACGYVRVAPHSFSTTLTYDASNHWNACTGCNQKKNVTSHSYDNACDTTCACGYVRVAPHSFSATLTYDTSSHWYACAACGAKMDETAHSYDNACDTTCDCGYVRVAPHSFSATLTYDTSSHWYACTVCGIKKDVAAHEYPNDWDKICKVCDYSPYAYRGTCGATGSDVKWGLYSDGKLVIYGTGAMGNYEAPWYSYSNSIKNVTIANGVTSIGNSAFSECVYLTRVFISDSVTSIGNFAFSDCYRLTSVIIPDRVTSIGDCAFYGCEGLTSISIPDSVTSIGSQAFWRCTKLKYSTYNNATYLGNERNSFLYLNEVTDQTIHLSTIHPKTKLIGSLAFRDCKDLRSVSIPEGVTDIGNQAFYNCEKLTEIIIPNSVTRIGYGAFKNCSNLLYLAIPSNVTSIEEDAFSGCGGLTAINVIDIANWCSTEFGNSKSNPLYYAGKMYLDGTLVNELVIPEGVTSIRSHAFVYCTNLTSVTIPDSVTSIGYGAFDDCNALERVTVLSKTAEIYDDASTLPTSATIYGYEDSTAEDYANKYSRAFVTLLDHSFSTTLTYDEIGHWYACSDCTEKKNWAAHTWDGGVLGDVDAATGEATKVFTCTVCSATKEKTVTIYQVMVESKNASVGSTVTVNISFADTTDIKAIGLDEFSYDHSVLELISGEWIGADKAPIKSVDLDVGVAMLTFEENTSASGLVLSLTFKVSDDAAEGEYKVGCHAEVKKMISGVENTLEAVVSAGTISVCDYVRGDVNGDEMVDSNDAIHLLRHVLFPSKFEINQSGDMNGDGDVNSNDAIHLLRHVLFPSKFPLS